MGAGKIAKAVYTDNETDRGIFLPVFGLRPSVFGPALANNMLALKIQTNSNMHFFMIEFFKCENQLFGQSKTPDYLLCRIIVQLSFVFNSDTSIYSVDFTSLLLLPPNGKTNLKLIFRPML